MHLPRYTFPAEAIVFSGCQPAHVPTEAVWVSGDELWAAHRTEPGLMPSMQWPSMDGCLGLFKSFGIEVSNHHPLSLRCTHRLMNVLATPRRYPSQKMCTEHQYHAPQDFANSSQDGLIAPECCAPTRLTRRMTEMPQNSNLAFGARFLDSGVLCV
eukprot:89616-Pelagomonas_calceolata.AAC.3